MSAPEYTVLFAVLPQLDRLRISVTLYTDGTSSVGVAVTEHYDAIWAIADCLRLIDVNTGDSGFICSPSVDGLVLP